MIIDNIYEYIELQEKKKGSLQLFIAAARDQNLTRRRISWDLIRASKSTRLHHAEHTHANHATNTQNLK